MTTTVNDVMTRNVISVRDFTSYKDIVRMLLEHGISAMPVLGEADRVAGVVSETDLIEKEAHQDGVDPAPWELLTRRGRRTQAKAHGTTARELMTEPAITIGPGANLSEAARRMRTYKVKRLPVIDEKGALAGIVSHSDLLAPYLRPDAHLHDEAIHGVLVGEMGIDPEQVGVRVREGIVTLNGEVENLDVARTTIRLVRAIAGVVDVVDELRVPIQEREHPFLQPFRTPSR
ncbi:MAG TPA: CBS domain-containing protein [Actinocrinis sp.]|nr:CBS domain-containing protein [Actinocrinis sp.]